MDDSFEIPLIYKGKDLSFPAVLITTGYTYKIQVDVFGKLVNFEPDEERNFRALINSNELDRSTDFDILLIQEIATTLQTLFKEG